MTDDRDDDEPEELDEPEEPEPEAQHPRPRIGRPPKAPVKPPKQARPGAGAPRFDRQGNEADLVWNQICEWLPTTNDAALPTRSPYDIMIVVRRAWPPHQSGETMPVGRGFSGSAISGGEAELPGSALINYVMQYYHLPTTDQPASYDIHFFKKSTGSQITIGRLPMPSGPECRAALQAGEQARRATGGPGLGYPTNLGGGQGPPPPQPPPQGPPWQPPPSWQPPPGYTLQAQGPSIDAATMHELSYLRGALGEALTAAREGRQPVIQPPSPPPAPGAAGVEGMEDRIVAKVLMALRATGGGAPPAPVQNPGTTASAPATQTVGGLAGMVERAVGGILETTVKTVMGNLEKNIKAGMGMGAPGGGYADEETDTPAAQVVPPENPADAVPWTAAAVGSNWGNGSPVRVALNKETGNLDPTGLMFENPIVAERMMGLVEGLGNAVTEAIKKFSAGPQPPGAAQVVREIPRAAVDAGMGYAPPPPQAARQVSGWGAPAAPPPPPAPPPPVAAQPPSPPPPPPPVNSTPST